jgi:hypothetical protein
MGTAASVPNEYSHASFEKQRELTSAFQKLKVSKGFTDEEAIAHLKYIEGVRHYNKKRKLDEHLSY